MDEDGNEDDAVFVEEGNCGKICDAESEERIEIIASVFPLTGRPFSALNRHLLPKYFEQQVADPFMLKVCNVLPGKRDIVPAITHVDGTARLQTIHAETNSRFHTLLKEFEKLSGVPVLLNTSFNVMGEPIIESPYDAIRCFFTTGLDVLVLGNYVVEKVPAANPPR